MIQLTPTTEVVEVQVILDTDGLKILRDPFSKKLRVFSNGREEADDITDEWLNGIYRIVNALLKAQGIQ